MWAFARTVISIPSHELLGGLVGILGGLGSRECEEFLEVWGSGAFQTIFRVDIASKGCKITVL